MFIKFEWLKFKNLRSYSNKETHVDFKNGLTLITGTNGVGKTSMIEALTFNLYGKPYTKIKINELINRYNKKGLYTESQFKIGNDVYNIKRGLKPNNLEITKNGENLEMLSSKTLSQDDIDKILGINYKMFKNVISLSAYNKPFLDKDTTKAERREIVETIFNINVFADMLKILKKDISILKTDVEIEESNIKILEENINTDRKRLEEIKNSKENFTKTKENDINELKNHNEYNSKIITETKNKIEFKQSELKSKKQEIKEKIELLTNDIEIENKKILDEINDFKNNFIINEKELTEKIEKLNSELVQAEKIKSEVESEILVIETEFNNKIEKLNSDYEKLIVDLNEKIKSYETVDKDLKSLNDEKDVFIVNNKFLNSKIKESKDLIEFYKNNDVCSQCKHEINNEEKEKLIQKQNDFINSYNNDIEKNNKEVVKFNKKIEEIKEKIEKRNGIKNKLETAEDIKDSQILKFKNEKREKTDNINEKLNGINIDVIRNNIENYSKQLGVNKSNYENDIENIKIKSKVNKLENEINNLKNSNYEEMINNEVKVLNEKIESLTDIINSNKNKIEEINKREFDINSDEIENLFNEKCDKYKIKYKDYKHNSDRLLIYNLTKDILSDNGIKTYFFKKLIPLLNQKINIYLDKFNIPISLSFDEEMNNKICSLTGRDEDIDYNSFSGGERKRIDMSILFSFIDLMKIITNWNCNIMVMDEVLDSGIDESGLSDLISNLKTMLYKTDTLGIYVISHKITDSISSMFDSIWTIEKINQFSKINFN